jgi:hypothetical protein
MRGFSVPQTSRPPALHGLMSGLPSGVSSTKSFTSQLTDLSNANANSELESELENELSKICERVFFVSTVFETKQMAGFVDESIIVKNRVAFLAATLVIERIDTDPHKTWLVTQRIRWMRAAEEASGAHSVRNSLDANVTEHHDKTTARHVRRSSSAPDLLCPKDKKVSAATKTELVNRETTRHSYVRLYEIRRGCAWIQRENFQIAKVNINFFQMRVQNVDRLLRSSAQKVTSIAKKLVADDSRT